MEKPQFNSVIVLQNLMSSNNIERLKQDFIKNNFQEEEPPFDIDYKQGILYYFDSYLGKTIEKRFEDYLKELLWQATNAIKAEIDLSNSLFSNKEKINFWKTILNSFDYIKEKDSEVIINFPISLKPFAEIEEYLERKYHFIQNPQFGTNSYFTLKPKYGKRDLEKIFDFITEELYLDSEIFDFSDFYTVLNEEETNVKLTFNCSTKILVCFLDEFSNLFTDFKRKKIEESGRFLSKSNTTITEGNFNTTVSRIKNESSTDLDKVRHFFSVNFPQ